MDRIVKKIIYLLFFDVLSLTGLKHDIITNLKILKIKCIEQAFF